MKHLLSNAFKFILLASLFVLIALISLSLSDRYTSHSQFVIKGHEAQAPDLLGSLTGIPSSTNTQQESEILIAYLESHEALDLIHKKLNLYGMFGCQRAEWISCLRRPSSKEDALAYWKKHINLHLETSSSIISLKTQGFTPEIAQTLNKELLAISSAFINNYNEQMMRDSVSEAQTTLLEAREALAKQESILTKFQQENNTTNPQANSESRMKIIYELEGQLSRAQTELATYQSYMRDTAPAVIAQQQKIEAIKQQLSKENGLLIEDTANKQPGHNFEKILLDKELAQKAYTMAVANAESIAADAKRQQRYLITISNPELPDDPSHPKRIQLIIKILLGLFLLFSIGQLILLTIKDHIGWT